MISARREVRRAPRTRLARGWVAIALLTGCGGAITSSDRVASDVAEVAVAPVTASVIVGGTLPLQATMRDASGQVVTGPTVVWSVQDTSIATVSSAGVVSARAVGSTQVAASANGRSGLAAITVMPAPVASVTVTPARVDLAPGTHASLAAVAYDAAGNALDGRAIIWASSNSNVVTVDANGTVTGTAAGAASVTATSEGVTGNAAISVTVPVVARLAIQPRSATIQRGATLQLSIDITDAAGAAITGRKPTWTSSNSSVAVVSATGLVTAVAPGSTRIAAALDGKADTVNVAVVAVPVGSVTVQPTAVSVAVGQSTTFTATVKDANGAVVTDRQVAWTTSNAAVATVSQAGVVKAVAAGTATISATSEGRSGSASITATVGPVDRILLSPTSITDLRAGHTAQLTATAVDANGNVIKDAVFTWKSSSASIATVSGTGLVTGVRRGSTSISATFSGKTGSANVDVR